jgi:hypothetical protein
LKVYTWETNREHAVLQFRGGRRAVVCGGTHSIRFEVRQSGVVSPLGQREEYASVTVLGQPLRIEKLVMHTHLAPTGPSRADFEMLKLLGQKESIIYEIFGPGEGTRFFADRSDD